MANQDHNRRATDHCESHKMLDYKSTLALAFLGGNLLGILLVAISAGYATLKVIPEFKESVLKELNKASERYAIVEYKITALERVANKYMEDIGEYEAHMKGAK